MEDELIRGNEALNIFSEKDLYESEKDLCNAISCNMGSLVGMVMPGAEIKEVKREYSISKGIRFCNKKGIPNLRVDFRVVTNKGVILIEAKNPRYAYSELRNAVAQCMDYSRLLKPEKMVLVSSRHSESVTGMIEEYNLDIVYILATKNNVAILKGFNNDR